MIDYDISGKIGPMFERLDAEWPMYSYNAPATTVWNAIASSMRARGWTDEQIKGWLQSKDARWAMDGLLGDILYRVTLKWADDYTVCRYPIKPSD